jgi:small subunit ribosomal protein S17
MSSQGNKRILNGRVVSDKMDKTIVVMVERTLMHPVYKKYIKRRKKYMAHDPENQCGVGDKVMIAENRPLSRRKRWVLKEIVEKAV